MATVSIHYEKLIESTGALVERGIVSRETLLRRASCLKQTIDALEFKAFALAVCRISTDDLETQHRNADNPMRVARRVEEIGGSGLDREDLGYSERFRRLAAASFRACGRSSPEPSPLGDSIRKSRRDLAIT